MPLTQSLGLGSSPATFSQVHSHHFQKTLLDCGCQDAGAPLNRYPGTGTPHRQIRIPDTATTTALPRGPPPILWVTWTPGPRACSMSKRGSA